MLKFGSVGLTGGCSPVTSPNRHAGVPTIQNSGVVEKWHGSLQYYCIPQSEFAVACARTPRCVSSLLTRIKRASDPKCESFTRGCNAPSPSEQRSGSEIPRVRSGISSHGGYVRGVSYSLPIRATFSVARWVRLPRFSGEGDKKAAVLALIF